MKENYSKCILLLSVLITLSNCGGGSSEEISTEVNIRQTIEEHDLNDDGVLSATEIREAHAKAFALLDADGDGDFDADDFGVELPKMEEFDTDGSGSLTAEEFISNGERLALEKVDHNEDNTVTADEMLVSNSLQ